MFCYLWFMDSWWNDLKVNKIILYSYIIKLYICIWNDRLLFGEFISVFIFCVFYLMGELYIFLILIFCGKNNFNMRNNFFMGYFENFVWFFKFFR